MWRFIVCSFAFLGWGFYELSGGSDFAPETQQAAIFAPLSKPISQPVELAKAKPAPAIPQVVLASVTTRAEPLEPLNAAALIEPAKLETVVEPTPVVAASQPLDIRTVNPNRVNVRGGPSTNFDVVAKLRKNDAVTILSDDGAGWVEIETIDGQVGWMADFLLVASN